jgi:hypothetical protein
LHRREDPLGQRTIAEAEIFFAHLDQARSALFSVTTSFVFSGELKNLLGSLAAAEKPPEQGS